MKKLLFALIAITTVSLTSYSQCTPDPTAPDGITPPSDSLGCVERGVSYSETLTVKLPASVSGITLDNITVNDITGLPTGLSYFCSPANCAFAGGGTYCVEIAGNTTDPVGSYDLSIVATVTVTIPVVGSQTLGPADLNDLIAQSPVPLPIPVPSYSLEVIEQGDPCRGVSTSLTASISGDDEFCTGGSTTLTANAQNSTGTVSYAWSTTETTPMITVSSAGTYTVTITDDNGFATNSIAVSEISAPVSDFTVAQSNADVTFTDASTDATGGTWYFGDGATSTDQNPTHTYAANGTYTVKQVVDNACGSDSSTKTVTITGVYVEGLGKEATLQIFPNPTNGNFTLNLRGLADDADFDISIYDLTGKLIFTERISSESGVILEIIDLAHASKGIYSLQVHSSKGAATSKLAIY